MTLCKTCAFYEHKNISKQPELLTAPLCASCYKGGIFIRQLYPTPLNPPPSPFTLKLWIK